MAQNEPQRKETPPGPSPNSPSLLFEYQCRSGKFIRLANRIKWTKNRFGSENRIESKLFLPELECSTERRRPRRTRARTSNWFVRATRCACARPPRARSATVTSQRSRHPRRRRRLELLPGVREHARAADTCRRREIRPSSSRRSAGTATAAAAAAVVVVYVRTLPLRRAPVGHVTWPSHRRRRPSRCC